MARERSDLIGERIGAFQEGCETHLLIERAVDISEACPDSIEPGCKVLLQYTTSKQGTLVQLVHCDGDKDVGAYKNWYLHQLERLEGVEQQLFSVYAQLLGISSEKLRELISQNAPAGACVAA